MFYLSRIAAQTDGMYLLPLVIIISLYVIIWIFREPFNGTILIFLTIPIGIPLIGDNIGGMSFFNLRLYDVFTVITFGSLLLAILCRRYPRFAKTSLSLPFGLYCFANLLSLFNSPYPMDGVRQFVKLLGANVTMYMVITTTLNSRARLEKVIKILLVGGILVCLMGTVQNLVFRFFGINWFFLKSNHRATATFAEAGWYAQYIGLLFAIALPLYFSKAFKLWKPWLLICIYIYLMVVASELSRSAYVTTFVVILAAWALKIGGDRLKSSIKMTAFVVVTLILASLITSYFVGEMQFVRLHKPGQMFSPEEASNAIRVNLARQTWSHIVEHPVVGQGFGSWGRVMADDFGNLNARGGSAFNIFLGVLYDGGILGLIAFALICYCYLSSCFGAIRSTKDSYNRTLLHIAILVFVSLFVSSLFHPIWQIAYTWLVIAMGVANVNIVKGERLSENRVFTAKLKSGRWEQIANRAGQRSDGTWARCFHNCS